LFHPARLFVKDEKNLRTNETIEFKQVSIMADNGGNPVQKNLMDLRPAPNHTGGG
jgi:hypothetical protein